MKKALTYLLLALIFCLAFFLRTMYLSKDALTFGYDQARDAYSSIAIASGDTKIQGPPSSAPGLFHGVFYYYFLAPAYALGHGSPVVAAYYLAFINSLTVFIVFLLGYLATKKGWVGLTSAFLFAISFESTQYATWLSNPTVAIVTVPLLYLGLWQWSENKSKWGPILLAVGLGLSVQSEIFLAYHIVPIAIWLAIRKKNINIANNIGKKQIVSFIVTLGIVLSSFLISEIKFGFNGINGVKSLLINSDINLAYTKSIGDFLTLYLNQIGRIFAFNSYPGNIGYGGGFVIVLAIYSLIKKDKFGMFLSLWLFSHLSVVSVGGVSTPFLMVGIGPAVSLIIGCYLVKWWGSGYKFITIGIIILLIYGNLSYIFKENSKGSTLFSIQKDMVLSKQLAAIDYTYHEANGEMFTTNSLTSPLWIDIVWTYLYKWYGVKNYGFAPEWNGKDQIGQLDSLQKVSNNTKLFFLILEPMDGIPPKYLEQAIQEEDAVSTLVDQKEFGTIIVQKRYKNIHK